jgi:hypothetical protein
MQRMVHPVKLAVSGVRQPALRSALGQAVTASPTTPPGAMMPPSPQKAPLIDSALLGFVFAGLGAAAAFTLGSLARKGKAPTKATTYSVIGGALAIKAVVDLYDIRER